MCVCVCTRTPRTLCLRDLPSTQVFYPERLSQELGPWRKQQEGSERDSILAEETGQFGQRQKEGCPGHKKAFLGVRRQETELLEWKFIYVPLNNSHPAKL